MAEEKENQEQLSPSGPGSSARASENQMSEITVSNRTKHGSYDIYTDRSLQALVPPGLTAFEARDHINHAPMMAVISGRNQVARTLNVSTYRSFKNPYCVHLDDMLTIDWPEGGRAFAFLYERPVGTRIMQDMNSPVPAVSEDKLIPLVIRPVLSALVEMRNSDFVHGAINLTNMYWTTADHGDAVMLGECLATLPSCLQPALFESPDRGMAQPDGRGLGSNKDDLYALGVCVALLLRGTNYLAGLSDDEIVRRKIDQGSYGVLLGRERVPTVVSEFLRGALTDDEMQRWTLDDALAWLDGRRLSPKQPRMTAEVARAFVFRGEKLWTPRAISHEFARNVSDAVQVLENGQLLQWVKRNFEDKSLYNRLEQAIAIEKDAATSQGKERMVSQACVALDSKAPLRYCGVSLYPRGYGSALATAIAQGGDVQSFGEIVAHQLFGFWYSMQDELRNDHTSMATLFSRCRSYLALRSTGHGIERVFYTLCKEAHCLSPLIKNYCVMGPGELLLALEKLSASPQRPETLLDRHMVAFLSVRDAKVIDNCINMLSSGHKGVEMAGALRAMAEIQLRYDTGLLPGIARWVIAYAESALERITDRDLREELLKKIKKQDDGDLAALSNLIDNADILNDDQTRYQIARREYADLVRQKEDIETQLKKNRHIYGRATGRQTAMILSAVLASMVIIGYLTMRFTGG